ncbi:MAG: hypothetical protein RSA10_00050 [Bacilli bacterium]
MIDLSVLTQPIASKIINRIQKSNNGVQAYIVSGTNEADLQKVSLNLAKALICPNKCSKCEKCNICKRIDENVFSELKTIFPVNNIIKKEEIMNLRSKFQTSSIESKNQVYIINHVEFLGASAANAILKFLEEPESNTVAIFTTSCLSSVMDTIISRCQIIKLTNHSTGNKEKNIVDFSLASPEIIDITKKFFDAIENKKPEEKIVIKKEFIKLVGDREKLRSSLKIMLLLYKDMLNYKINQFFEYFENFEIISKKHSIKSISSKISLILEYLNKLDSNVNCSLLIDSICIEIGEINDGKSSRS